MWIKTALILRGTSQDEYLSHLTELESQVFTDMAQIKVDDLPDDLFQSDSSVADIFGDTNEDMPDNIFEEYSNNENKDVNLQQDDKGRENNNSEEQPHPHTPADVQGAGITSDDTGNKGDGGEVHADILGDSKQKNSEKAEKSIAEEIAIEEGKVDTNPTEAQKEAGNYKKGHVTIQGLNITIENSKGSVRSGVDPSGKEWSQTMNNTYGYALGTKGKDGDHIDIFLDDNPLSEKVFIVDQVNPDKSFDEHKVMIGFNSIEEAKDAYLSNYEEGWQGLGDITETTMEQFREWGLSEGKRIKPFAEYKQNNPNDIEDIEIIEVSSKNDREKALEKLSKAKQKDIGKVAVKIDGRTTVMMSPEKAEKWKHEHPGILYRSDDNTTIKDELKSIKQEAIANGTFMKAPNGNPTNLNEKQWLQVRTKAFKKWFGDWEKTLRIEKLRNSKPLEITGNEYMGKYDLNAESAQKWIKDNLRSKYIVKDTGESVSITRVGAEEVTSHNRFDETHLKSIASIPDLLSNAIFIEEQPSINANSKYDSYRYYVVGTKIDGVDYTAKVVIGVKQGKKYYDHRLTEIEKTKLIDIINQPASDFTSAGNASLPPYITIKDTRLISILQTNSSKVVDKNGEPLVVYHQTNKKFTEFIPNFGTLGKGVYFSDADKIKWYGKNSIPVFLNIRNIIDANSVESETGFTAGSIGADRILREKGFDGITAHKNSFGETVAFSPNQIKSATDNSGEFNPDNEDIRFRKSEGQANNEAINDKFNQDLQAQIEGKLPKGYIYKLGNSSIILQSASIPDLPIELAASRLRDKSIQENHPFILSEVKDLPKAIQNPLAVFRSATHIGSYVLMTEISHNGKNFIAAIEANKIKDKIEINDIRSIHYRSTNTHFANWIIEGLLEYANKEKMPEWLTKQRYNSAEVRQLFKHAAKIVNNFKNPTLEQGEIKSEVTFLSESLNTPIETIDDLSVIPASQVKKRKAKGWYDPKTGKVIVVLPNNSSTADVQATILHEAVGHKGLRGLLGEQFNPTMDKIFDSMSKHLQADYLARYGDRIIAAEEYMSEIAEKNQDPTIWERIKNVIRDAFRALGIDLRISNADMRYMIWRSKNRLKNANTASAIETIKDIAESERMRKAITTETLNKENAVDFEYEVKERLSLRPTKDYFKVGDGVILRIKDHPPKWGNFNYELFNGGVKKIVNVTIGDFYGKEHIEHRDYSFSSFNSCKVRLKEPQRRWSCFWVKSFQFL